MNRTDISLLIMLVISVALLIWVLLKKNSKPPMMMGLIERCFQ